MIDLLPGEGFQMLKEEDNRNFCDVLSSIFFLCCRIVLFGTYWLDVKICTARMNACKDILGSYNISCCFENVSELG